MTSNILFLKEDFPNFEERKKNMIIDFLNCPVAPNKVQVKMITNEVNKYLLLSAEHKVIVPAEKEFLDSCLDKKIMPFLEVNFDFDVKKGIFVPVSKLDSGIQKVNSGVGFLDHDRLVDITNKLIISGGKSQFINVNYALSQSDFNNYEHQPFNELKKLVSEIEKSGYDFKNLKFIFDVNSEFKDYNLTIDSKISDWCVNSDLTCRYKADHDKEIVEWFRELKQKYD